MGVADSSRLEPGETDRTLEACGDTSMNRDANPGKQSP